ncbi:MAG: radical SAM protein [Bacteroidaceae bacterium]|nr:radical SAM protein [Bacteroidaceae bacterium]
MDLLSDANPVEKQLVEKANSLQVPISTAFELSPVCNLNCQMCYIRLSRQQVKEAGGTLGMEFWLQLAEQFKREGTLFVLLTGGEPLLYPHFRELYLGLHQMGFILSVNTNATLITEEIADMLATHRPRIVHLTLYGASDKTYSRLCHVRNGFSRAYRGFQLLKERGIHMRINLTQTALNQEDYDALLGLVEETDTYALAANYLSVFSHPTKGSAEILEVRNPPQLAAENEIKMLMHKKGKDFGPYVADAYEYLTKPVHPVLEGTALTCRAGKSSCWVNWKGELKACVDMEEPSVDLKKTPVHEAWAQLKEAVKHLPLHTECKDCKLKPFCDVCYANAANEKKHCGSLDYLCQMAHAKADILYELAKRHFSAMS